MRKFLVAFALLALLPFAALAQAPTAGQPLSSWGAAATAAGTDLIPTTQGGTLKKQTLTAVDTYIESLNLANLGNAATARTNLGVPLGTSGAVLCLLNSNCTFSGNNTFSGTSSFGSTVSGAGITSLFASPPAIGGTAPGSGAFTTLSATSTVSGSGFTALLASPTPIGSTAPSTGAFTTLSATSTVSGTGFNNLFASPPAIGGTSAAAGSFTTLTATSAPITFSGLSAGTQVSCLGLNSSNQIVLNAAACGSGTGSNLTVQDTASHSVSGVTTLTFGAGGCVSGTTPNASMIPCSPDRTVSSGAVTFTSADWAGQVNNNVATNTATIPGTGTLGTSNTVIFTNQASTPVTITNSQTVNGLGLATKLHTFGFYGYTGNGASADAWGFPGYDTITVNAVPVFVDASGALTASELSESGTAGLVAGAATGGAKGTGTINAVGLFVNGTAVGTGGTVTNSGTLTSTCVILGNGTTVVTCGQATYVNGTGTLTIGNANATLGNLSIANATGAGLTTLTTANTGASNFTATLPANTGTIAELNLAQTFSAAQTFNNSDIKMVGSSTGATTLTSANSGASNFTLTLPAVTDTVATIGTSQTWTAGQAVTPDTSASCGTISSGGTATPNFANSNSCQITMTSTGGLTVANPTNIKAGQTYIITLTQSVSGSGSVTWSGDFKWAGGTAPTLSTAGGDRDDVSCYAFSTSALDCVLAGLNFH